MLTTKSISFTVKYRVFQKRAQFNKPFSPDVTVNNKGDTLNIVFKY